LEAIVTITKLSDVIIPGSTVGVTLNNMIKKKSIERSAFFRSGFVSNAADPNIGLQLGNDFGDNGGKFVTALFRNRPNDAEQIMADTKDLTVNKFTYGQQSTPIMERAQSYGITDLAVDLGGDDPLEDMAEFWADYWIKRQQIVLINVLNGALGASSATDNVYDISGLAGANAVIGPNAFIIASNLLGDQSDQIVAVAMHSAFYTSLLLQNLITFVPTAGQGKPIPQYLGKDVIVDDGLPYNTSTKVGTLFLGKRGAVTYQEAGLKTPIEVERQALVNSGQEYSVSRKKYIMHPNGFKWDTSATITDPTPNNAELATSANWTRVYSAKEVGIIAFKAKAA
jgi:hypothetical protein